MSDHLDSRAGRLAAALDDFLGSSPDVEAAAVVSFDGLPMASALPDHLEEDRVGAMSAALLSLGEQAAVGLGRGRLNQVFVEGEHGFVFLMSCRDQAVLAAVAARPAKIGFMLYEMRRAAETVGHVLAADDAPDVDVATGVTPHLAAVPMTPAWTHPSTYGDRDDDAVQQAVEAFAVPVRDQPPVEYEESEPAWARTQEEPFAALGELRAVSADGPATPAPSMPPPVAPASPYSADDARGDDEADLLAVLATEPLDRDDDRDHDLLTEALFEVRRATGGDASQVPSWARPDTSGNGWG
ncbi:MAG TPA: roadblock/LC7 domain-containing protein [Egicoccus sp.]|nr:roadblock/LC7 domain-containing protein [Egicoccus sp.]HSK21865.1 roadblock/LC7 domain-containing protein [Egicoccus sp.]